MDLQIQVGKIATKFKQTEEALMQPDVANDMARFTGLNKEYAELKPVVEEFGLYEKALADKEGAAALLADPGLDAEMKAMAQAEYDDLLTRIPQIEEKLKILLLPKDADDARNVMLEIRAGTGGEEAALFAADLFRLYSQWALTQGLKVEIQESSPAEMGGYRELIARVSGDNVYAKLKFESGVHRVQRVPATETQGRVHTSAATVAVLPEAQEVDVHIAEKDLRIDVFRSSGPGGQSVNTTDSAVRVTHLPTGVVVQCQDEKSQIKNKAKALTILRSRILAAEKARQDDARSAARKSLVGSGDRSEKIRTYNYPQNRVTDHRIELTMHNLPDFMAGGKAVGEMINALHRADEAVRLTHLTEDAE